MNKMHRKEELLENEIWIGVTWREAFVVPFIPGTVPAWSDTCFNAVEWNSSSPPRSNGDQGWVIACSPATDPDGWVYGTAFDHLREDRPGGRASKRANDRVRSRLWCRSGGPCHADASAAQASAAAAKGAGSTADGSSSSSSGGTTEPGSSNNAGTNQSRSAVAAVTSNAAAAVGVAAGTAASAGKAALTGAVGAMQAMPGAVKRASFAGMVNTFLKLVKDAAARHNTTMITPDFTGWFFVISNHSEQLKRQQLGQLQHLVWFSQEQQLQEAMKPAGLGSNPAGVVLHGARAALAAAAKQESASAAQQTTTATAQQAEPGPVTAADGKAAVAAAAAAHGDATGAAARAAVGVSDADQRDRSKPRSSSRSRGSSGTPRSPHNQGYQLPGQPFNGLMMHIGGSSSNKRISSSSQGRQQQQQQKSSSGGPSGLQLHIGPLDMLDELLAGARYSQAAYGYVAAAGHMSSLGNALKMLAAMPHFNAITGASLEANIRALNTLAGIAAEDVLLAAWHNDTFRPCHYVAVDSKRGCIVLGVRGSLELGDLETDVTAAPLAFEFQGVAGWVHEGLLAAAAYVVSNTVDALAEAAERRPGWPLVVAGHSLGGGVAALVTLLLQQPGAAPRSICGVRCVAIGPAAVLSQELCELCEQYVTSVIVGADAIPRLSTYSVESLLLDLVNASLSRRVTNQLAATTSSVAASTADAFNSLAAGLSKLAETATNNVVSNVNTMKTSLANIPKGLPSIPLMEGALGSMNFLGLPGIAADSRQQQQQASLYTTGTGSIELMRQRQQHRLLYSEAAAAAESLQHNGGSSSSNGMALREGSDGGLKQLHMMLQDERHQEALQRSSFEQQQQQQGSSQPSATLAPDSSSFLAAGNAAAAAAGAGTHASANAAIKPRLGTLALARPPTAATASDLSPATATAAGSSRDASTPLQAEARGVVSPAQPSEQQLEGPVGSPSGAAAGSNGSSGSSLQHIEQQPSQQPPLPAGGSGSSSKRPPGGPKLVSGGVAGSMMIFPKMDDASIISGIQQACAELKPHSGLKTIAADGTSSSSSCHSTSASSSIGAAATSSQQAVSAFAIDSAVSNAVDRIGAAAAADVSISHPPSGSSSSAPGAADVQYRAASTAAASSRVRSGSMSRCASEPSLQQWASDGLQPLGEPSWMRVSRESSQDEGGVGGNGQPGQQQQHWKEQKGAAGGTTAGDGRAGRMPVYGASTVNALESDLKKTARLYPPGRILWVLSEELVGPAAHQLISAVAAHLPKSTADSGTAAAAAGAVAGAEGCAAAAACGGQPSTPLSPAAASSTSASTSSSQLRPPLQVHMDMPTSIMGSGKQHEQQRQQQQQQQRQHALHHRASSHAAATAHAVAAASAKHILEDVHSLDAKRAAVAALHAAQHEHPPLQLREQQSPEYAAAELLRQQRQQDEDLQAANDAVPEPAHSLPAADAAGAATQQPRQGHQQQQQKQQQRHQKPLRTLQTQPAGVQMTTRSSAAAQASRSGSAPMEVDGSAAPPASCYWPLGSMDAVSPRQLPQELQELLKILGPATDAASALAIAHKKQLLFEHFWKQRRQDAAAAAAGSAVVQCGGGGGSSDGGSSSARRRSSSDSILLRYEDMIASVDDVGSAAVHGRPQTPQLELVKHSSWGHVGSSNQASASAARRTGGGARHGRGHSWSPGTPADESASSADAGAHHGAASLRLKSHRSDPAEGSSIRSSSASRLIRALSMRMPQRSLGEDASEDELSNGTVVSEPGGVQRLDEESQAEKQQVQLSVFQESEEYVQWAAQQATAHKQQMQQQQEDAARKTAAAQSSKQQLSFQELAAESLVELAQLPERIAGSLGALKIGGGGGGGGGGAPGSSSSSFAEALDQSCGDLGPGAAGLAALCAPMLSPTPAEAGEDSAARAATGVRMPPVVVMPERDTFGQLLLHKTAVLDHLPSNYVKVLTQLKEAYSQLPQQVREQQQQMFQQQQERDARSP